MSKYLKSICWCCGWYTYEYNPEHPANTFLKYQNIDIKRIKSCEQCFYLKCKKCNHLVHGFDEIPFVDVLTFDEGEG